MSKCWKCGRDLPDGQVECDEDVGHLTSGGDEDEEDLKHFRENFMEVDWNKIKTIEDLTAILSHIGFPMYVQKGTEDHKRLERFLKPVE